MGRMRVVFVATLLGFLTAAAHSQVTQQAKLNPLDAAPSDSFGFSAGVYGNYALVGASGHVGANNANGAGYVFLRNGATWTQQAQLTASDGATGDGFGQSVSISGDSALLGAPSDDGYVGSAYVFTRNGTTWMQQAKLTASDGEPTDTFGHFVSLHGDYAIIGSPLDDDLGFYSGSAYIFSRSGTTWTQQAKLLASDGGVEDYFGWSVSVHGNYASVGAPGDGIELGRAYIFSHSGSSWTQQAEFISPATVADNFGVDVSIHGDYALVGANGGTGATYNGAAYIYHRSGATWTLQDTLLSPEPSTGQIFGDAVSLFGDFAMVGARGDDAIAGDAGASYLYRRTGTNWNFMQKVTALDAGAGDFFGVSVAIDGYTAIIGAYADTDFGADTGSAYVFSVPEPTCAVLLAFGGLVVIRRSRFIA